jgi:hypothetical protein
MKKLVLVLTLAAFALTGAAFAQDPAYRDNIGVYADEGATELCANVGPDTPITLYVVLTKLTSSAVLGYEAKLVFNNLTELSYTDRFQNIDAATRPGEHIVGYPGPVPADGDAIVLADLQVMVGSFFNDPAAPSSINIENVYFHLLKTAAPAYLDASGEGARLYPSTIDGHEGGAVFFLNNGCAPVATDQDTWGGVKSLYR